MIFINLKELLNHFGIDCSMDMKLDSISIDSRKVGNNCLYLCLDNKYLDSFTFRDDIVVLSREEYMNKTVVVPDLDKVYIDMIHYFFNNPTSKVTVIGVTGTNGKTTIASSLAKIVKDSMYIGTLYVSYKDKFIHTDNTTPSLIDTLSYIKDAIDNGIKYVFMEVSSHSIVQDRVKGIDFDGLIFTNLTQDHLDYHKTMEEYFKAKKKLFDNAKKDSFAIINFDDRYGKKIIRDYKGRVIKYSYFDIVKSKYRHCKSCIKLKDVSLKYHLIGSFNAYNVMAMYKTLIMLGFSKKKSKAMIKKVDCVVGRMERVTKNIYIDYAHTPDALSKALYELKNICKGKLHVVFGCGGNRDKGKRSKMGAIASIGADYVYITNDNPRWENDIDIIMDICSGIDNRRNLYINPDRAECIEFAIMSMNKNDILIVAGKGHEDYMIIKDEKKYFSDRETILCIKNR